VSNSGFLPYGRQSISDDDISAVERVLRSDFLTGGPEVGAFEQKFSAAVSAANAVVCGNGTQALHLAALALNIGPGDAVVVPSVTFLATANAVHYVGGEVCFADVDPHTGLLTPQTLRDALSAWRGAPIKAVFSVHLGGQVADPAGIRAVADEAGLAVIEDACHALGTIYGNDFSVGACAHSDLAVFSLHPVKTIAMGEGGVITTKNATIAERLRRLRNHGMTRDATAFQDHDAAFDGENPNPWYYEMQELGYNYRATDIQCALGLSQLSRLDKFIARRQQLAARYDQLLPKLSPIVLPPQRVANCTPALHLYSARIDFEAAGQSRRSVMAGLSRAGIGTQVHYIPVHRQPYYQRFLPGPLPGADAYYRKTLSLPLFPDMRDDDPDRVVQVLASVLHFPS